MNPMQLKTTLILLSSLILTLGYLPPVTAETDAEIDYRISDGRFVTSKGEIPKGCFGQLITEMNGDNTVAAIFINSASLRGCIHANFPYPGGEEIEVTYKIIEALDNHEYKLTVCQVVDGSMGASCDKILVKFVNRNYILEDHTKKVLSLEKIGEW